MSRHESWLKWARGTPTGALGAGLFASAIMAGQPVALAQSNNPECTSGICGSPQQNGGGGGGGGGGSILYNYTDDGQTYSYTDDADQDGIADNFDNCVFTPNRDQTDTDGDGIGDVCDNCPYVANKDQTDTNGNGIGDACDPDIDGDGVLNAADNCPKVPNPDQADTNHNGIGDACDPDIDGDSVLNAADNCPYVYNPQQLPTDPETFAAEGKPCTIDTDLDGVPNDVDNCPYVYNPDQTDTDHNGVGDACDPDIDGDRVLNGKDNCPNIYNPDQKDSDNDGIGDVCDPYFCLVLDRRYPDECLDPTKTFQIGAATSTTADVGQRLRLPLFANRMNVGIRYSWTIVSRPAGSWATVQNASGTVSSSGTGYEYSYPGAAPVFSPDANGTWQLRLHAELVKDDPLYPGNDTADHDLTVTVSGSKEGCASAGDVPGLALLLLGLLRRRRS